MLCFINYVKEQEPKIHIVGPLCFNELCPGRFLVTVSMLINMLMNNSIKHIAGPVVFFMNSDLAGLYSL